MKQYEYCSCFNSEPEEDGEPEGSEPVVRTAKAERRQQERQRRSGDAIQPESNKDLSPSEERMIKAEKRAEWRKAR